MNQNLRNKTILVTGAGQGIGNALCKSLLKLDANVIAVARSADQLTQLKSENPKIQTVQVDLKNWNETREALKNVPPLDGLVNNAGIAIIKPFLELTEKDFDELGVVDLDGRSLYGENDKPFFFTEPTLKTTFDVNIKAVFNVTQALTPKLKDGSTIVMVSSLASTRSFDGHAAYSATKAAVDSLTRSLALELGPRRIRVNSVNPTVVLTQMGRENWSDPKKSEPLLKHIPLHRFCEVQEVTDAIVYLLSDNSSFVNGNHLRLEGGYSVS